MKKSLKATLFILLLLTIDQFTKILVKTNMNLYEDIRIFNWFYIHFIENPGMAFGITLGSKTFLTVFRILVSGLVLYYIVKLIKSDWNIGYILCVCLIFTGAIGNIIDCLFYGVVFSESTPWSVATFLPEGGGYAPFLSGKVVDMLYFPIFTFPSWIPFLGGELFFSPVFNFADTSITVGVFILIIFYRKEFNSSFDQFFQKTKKQTDKSS